MAKARAKRLFTHVAKAAAAMMSIMMTIMMTKRGKQKHKLQNSRRIALLNCVYNYTDVIIGSTTEWSVIVHCSSRQANDVKRDGYNTTVA